MGYNSVKYGSWEDYLNELDGIKDYCKKFGQDWAFCMGGMEGAGKSTLAIKTAMHLEPDFNLKEQIVDSLKEYVQLTKKIRFKPFKVINFDEAVNSFFSRSAMETANKILVKLFITNRSMQHFHILTIPSVFYLDKYLREWRTKTFTYTWTDWQYPDRRFFAVYHRKAYKKLIMGGAKARKAMLDKDELINKFPPNFITTFKPLEEKVWKEYEDIKTDFQENLLEEAEQEAVKLESQRKVGFHKQTPLPEFIRWLISKYGHSKDGNVYLHFTQEQVREDAATNMNTIHYLINSIQSKRYIESIGKTQYILTDKGAEAMKPEHEKNA